MLDLRSRIPETMTLRALLVSLLTLFIVVSGYAANTDYRIEGKLEEDKRIISGSETIEFTNSLDQAVSEIVLKLEGNFLKEPNPYISKANLDQEYPAGFDPGWTEVKNIEDPDGNELDYSRESLPPYSQKYSLENTMIRVELEEELEPNERYSISLEFSTKFPRKKTGDEEFYQGAYTWRFGWYPTLSPAEWWKGYDRESYSKIELPTADYQITLDVPQDFEAAGTTVSKGNRGPDQNRKLLKLELDEARSAPLAGSSDYRKHREEFKEYTIEILHFPGYQDEARILASYANEILGFYSERFGSYKRRTLTFTQNPRSGYFGMAADGVISLGNSFFEEKDLALSTITDRLAEYIVAHEIAHQWFGIGVGANMNSQNWISEAFCEYLALQYFHDKYPEDEPNLFRFERDGLIRNAVESQMGYVNLRDHTFELPYILSFQKGFDEAIIKPLEEVKYATDYQTRVYKKGYMVLRTLEGIIGEEKMEEFIREIYAEYKTGFVNVETLASRAREVGEGKIPDDFFQEWLFTSGHLDYGLDDLSSEKLESGGYANQIVVTKSGTLNTPVKLRATLTSGEEVERTVSLSSDRKVISWKTDQKIKKVTIDPESNVMDTNRLNNHFPRKVDISLGENRLPLDAYFITVGPGTISGRTPNKYAWSVGPGSAQGRANLNRNVSLTGGIFVGGDNLSELKVNGWIESQFDFWSNPETGSASQYWSQNRSLNLGLERFTDNDNRTHNFLKIGGDLSQTITDNWSIGLNASLNMKGDARFSFSARETERVFPNVYLNLSSNLGFGLKDLPSFMKFDLNELKSYGEWRASSNGNPGWMRYSYPGNYKLFSKVSLTFPISRDEKFFLGNLALVTRIDQSLFVAGGDTWDDQENIGLSTFKFEGGGKLSFQGKTLGGLLPFDLAIGYAYHGQDKGRPFFNLSLGF